MIPRRSISPQLLAIALVVTDHSERPLFSGVSSLTAARPPEKVTSGQKGCTQFGMSYTPHPLAWCEFDLVV